MCTFAQHFVSNMELERLTTADLLRWDETTFHRMYQLFYKALVAYSFRFVANQPTAEDIVQNVFSVLWRQSLRFPDEMLLRAYLYKSVRNKSFEHLSHLQVEKEYRERVLRNVQPEQLVTDEGEEQLFPEEIYRRLLTMIDSLPPRQREVFLMHMDGARNKEIAEKLNISVNTVKIQKKRALATLRQKLNEQQLLLLMLLIV